MREKFFFLSLFVDDGILFCFEEEETDGKKKFINLMQFSDVDSFFSQKYSENNKKTHNKIVLLGVENRV